MSISPRPKTEPGRLHSTSENHSIAPKLQSYIFLAKRGIGKIGEIYSGKNVEPSTTMNDTPALIPALIVLCLFLISGILSLCAAIADWNWFFNSKNCRMLTSRLSRRKARWLYGIIGCLILYMTVVIALDILSKTPIIDG